MADEPESGRDDGAGDEEGAEGPERPERDEHGRFVSENEDADDDAPDDDDGSTEDAVDETGETASDDAQDTSEASDEMPDDSDAGDDTSGDAANEIDAVDEIDADDETDIDEETGGNLQKVDSSRDDESESAETDESETADADNDSGESDDSGPSDESDEDADADDDAFPVKGMREEDVAWDPEKAGDPKDLEVDPDETDTESDDDTVGVQPEKQEIDESLWGEGPASDEEMPLADHIEEMMRRLAVVFIIAGGVSLVVLGLAQTIEWLPSAVDIIDLLWNKHIPGAPEQTDRRPRVYGPLELILTKLKVAGLAGILVGLPAFVYETYLFMRPGLYPRERKYYLAAVPTSLVLAIIGMTFAHFVVLPVIFDYFTTYTEGTATIAFGLAETFNLIILLMGYMAIVFQIPLFIMLAIWMNLVTRIWLEDKRLLFWGAFAGLAFLASPDPTGMAPIIIAATMIVLYEGTLALLRWTGN